MTHTGVLEAPTADDLSDLESLEYEVAQGLCDGDLAMADLQPSHLSTIWIDRGMMMNSNEAELGRSFGEACRGSSPEVRFTSEPRMGCEPSEAMPSAKDFSTRSVYRTGL